MFTYNKKKTIIFLFVTSLLMLSVILHLNKKYISLQQKEFINIPKYTYIIRKEYLDNINHDFQNITKFKYYNGLYFRPITHRIFGFTFITVGQSISFNDNFNPFSFDALIYDRDLSMFQNKLFSQYHFEKVVLNDIDVYITTETLLNYEMKFIFDYENLTVEGSIASTEDYLIAKGYSEPIQLLCLVFNIF